MTAATLTPAEQAEATRFGIHDEDALRDLAERADDEPSCVILRQGQPCAETVTHRAKCTACGAFLGTVCAGHAHALSTSLRIVRHRVCGTRATYAELVEVSPL